MIRKSKLSIAETLSKYRMVMDGGDGNHYYKTKAQFYGDSIKFSSHRLWTFYTHGIECANCGLRANFFAKEKHGEHEESYHLNLYAIDKSGDEILMTKDHITPKSEGGNDHISNYQTMCEHCNEKKGNKCQQ